MRKLILPIIIFILGWISFIYTVLSLSPYREEKQLHPQNLVIFLSSLFFLLASGVGLLLYFLNRIWSKKPILKTSLRRGVLVGLFAVIIGLLQITKTNNLVNIVLLILILGLIESYG